MNTGNIMENQMQDMHDPWENKNEELENIRKRAKRISTAIHYLFTDNAFSTPMKPNKYRTYRVLVKLQTKNIEQLSALFQ